MAKILIVDDDEDILDYLNQLLSAKYETFIADTFEKFLGSYAQHNYDLIICDLNLGNQKTAMDVLKHIGNRTPVMVITAATNRKEQEPKLKEMGCKDIVPKPFKTKLLFELIEKHSLKE